MILISSLLKLLGQTTLLKGQWHILMFSLLPFKSPLTFGLSWFTLYDISVWTTRRYMHRSWWEDSSQLFCFIKFCQLILVCPFYLAFGPRGLFTFRRYCLFTIKSQIHGFEVLLIQQCEMFLIEGQADRTLLGWRDLWIRIAKSLHRWTQLILSVLNLPVAGLFHV